MITCTNICCQTDSGTTLFEELNLEVGDTPLTVIMGGNGSGKTVLGMLLVGVRLPDAGTISRQSTSLEAAAYPPGAIGMVFQNPDDQFTAVTVERELAFGLENQQMPPAQIRVLVEAYLERYRLSAYRSRSPHLLSGGEKRRLALASVLITSPLYVILDEPYAMMEPSAVAVLQAHVRTAMQAGIRMILFTKNDADRVHADKAYVLQGGALSSLSRDMHTPRCCTYPCALPTTGSSHEKILIETKGVWYHYATFKKSILHDISCRIYQRERTLVVGKAGAGKTTFLSLLAGVVSPQRGTVCWQGSDVWSRAGKKILRTACAYGFQFPEEQFFAMTVDEELRYTALARGADPKIIDKKIADWYTLLGWHAQVGESAPWSLAYGMRRLVAILSLLAHSPLLVLLDEPFAGLDGTSVGMLQRIIAHAESTGITFVIAGHREEHPFLEVDNVIALTVTR